MAKYDWLFKGQLSVTGILPILLYEENAALLDETGNTPPGVDKRQDENHRFQTTLVPGETLVLTGGSLPLNKFTAIRSVFLLSDQPLLVTMNGGTARPGVRLLVFMADPDGNVLTDLTLENEDVSDAEDASVTLIVGGDSA